MCLSSKIKNGQVQDVLRDIQFLHLNLNSILECMDAPGIFAKDYKKLVNDVQVALPSEQVRLDMLEATIRLDMEVPTKAEKEVVYIDSICAPLKLKAHKSKKDVHCADSGSSDFDSDRHSAHSSSDP